MILIGLEQPGYWLDLSQNLKINDNRGIRTCRSQASGGNELSWNWEGYKYAYHNER